MGMPRLPRTRSPTKSASALQLADQGLSRSPPLPRREAHLGNSQLMTLSGSESIFLFENLNEIKLLQAESLINIKSNDRTSN